ncbi:TatD family hydrolase [Patescibacteria group bacterium]|nr:TatD family hydrolase [Patescibacteria group bacterium]
MLIDTHAHLNFTAFDKDREGVIKRCLKHNSWIINIGTNYQTSKKALEIAERYKKGIYAAIGLHPINLDTGLIKLKVDPAEFSEKTHGASEREGVHFEKEFDYEKYKELVKSPKVIAIGEIGLDYYWKPKTTRKKELFFQKQKDLLLKQLQLAKEFNLPVIFHCRMAHHDLIEILINQDRDFYDRRNRGQVSGVVHCFTGNWKQAQKFLEIGLYLGFNGIIFKLDLDEIIKKTPLEKILIETDCPYLSPPQFKDQRNEPLYVKYIAQEIAKIKNINFKKVAKITTKNAKELFKIN